MADLFVKVDITGTDGFNGFINILKEVIEDSRVPDVVKNDIKNKVNDLIEKNKED